MKIENNINNTPTPDLVAEICVGKKIMKSYIKIISFIATGVLSIILAICCFCKKSLDWESKTTYGGDAYTGIQNAAAQTSKNVSKLADTVCFGFGSILLVTGLTLVGIGISTPIERKEEIEEETESEQENTEEEPVSEISSDDNVNE